MVYYQLLLLSGCMERFGWIGSKNEETQNVVPLYPRVVVAFESSSNHLVV